MIKRSRCLAVGVVLLAFLMCLPATMAFTADTSVLNRDNLVAWCIVPFDAKKRGPAERVAMLKELGIRRCAYDWRKEHVPTFEQEILEYQKHGIEFFAFWSVHDDAFDLFKKHSLHPQIWHVIPNSAVERKDAIANAANATSDTETQATKVEATKVEAAVQNTLSLAERTKGMGCKLGLYNHGGWSGEPANLVAVCKRLHELGHDHVGIVYNFHHGHQHIDDWKQSFALMKPYILCLNLNGMNSDAKPKILGIGKGAHELEMIRAVLDSGYSGPIGIIDHREQIDARESLLENLDGLQSVREKLE